MALCSAHSTTKNNELLEKQNWEMNPSKGMTYRLLLYLDIQLVAPYELVDDCPD